MICYYGRFPIFPLPQIFSLSVVICTPARNQWEGEMNTKRINYLVKVIGSNGHKITFTFYFFLLFDRPLDFYLAQGQGLTSCVSLVCMSLYSARISFILINHNVISFGFTFASSRMSLRRHDLLACLGISVRLSVFDATFRNGREENEILRSRLLLRYSHPWVICETNYFELCP